MQSWAHPNAWFNRIGYRALGYCRPAPSRHLGPIERRAVAAHPPRAVRCGIERSAVVDLDQGVAQWAVGVRVPDDADVQPLFRPGPAQPDGAGSLVCAESGAVSMVGSARIMRLLDANGHRAGTRPKLKISRPRSSEASAQEGPSSAAHRRSGHGSAATGCSDIDHVPIVLLRRDRGAAGSGPFGSPRIGESGFWGSGRYPLASSQMGLGGLPLHLDRGQWFGGSAR